MTSAATTTDAGELMAAFSAARERLDRGAEALEAIATWQDDLRVRIFRARLIFELVDFDVDISTLIEEVQEFKRVCRAVSWRVPEMQEENAA